jgi:hypothetical protein
MLRDFDKGAPDTRLSRLTPLDRREEILPWRRAKRMTSCYLAWMPVSTFPPREAEREWLLHFISRLEARLKQNYAVEPHAFLEFKTISKVKDQFIRHAKEFMPMAGLGRHPGTQLPSPPTREDMKQLVESGRDIRVHDYMPDACYWFRVQSTARQCELFLGHAGMTIAYWKADPATKPPDFPIPPQMLKHEVLRQFDVKGLFTGLCATRDSFLARSKQIAGAGLENSLVAESVPFILPLLNTAEIFALRPEELQSYFELFDVYLRESPVDRGMVLASKHDIEEILIDLMKEMRDFKPVDRD